MKGKRIYLDYNATTPLDNRVKAGLIEAMEVFGNPSSLHSYGREARQLVEQSRSQVAEFIGASPEEIIFVGSGSEANNTVLSIFSCSLVKCTHHPQNKREVIITKIEHPCVLETAKCIEDRGSNVIYLNVDKYGKVNLEQLDQLITKHTGIVSVMMANNEIGTIQDIKTIASLVHKKGVLFHTDAVQAVGKIPVDVKDLDVDFLTLSGHKIYGPKGIGALYIKKGVPFCPFIRGGHQEKGRRAGTENVLGIAGLAQAVKIRKLNMLEENKQLLELKQILKKGIEDKIPDIQFNGHPTDCLAGTLNVSFEGAEGESILLYLDLEGISVSTGSACASGSLDPSHVLLATGTPVEKAHGSIRISMGQFTTREDIEYVLEVLPKVIKKIRDLSTAYNPRRS